MTVPPPLLSLATPPPSACPAAPGADFLAFLVAAEGAAASAVPPATAEEPPGTHAEDSGDGTPAPFPKAEKTKKTPYPDDGPPVWTALPQPPAPAQQPPIPARAPELALDPGPAETTALSPAGFFDPGVDTDRSAGSRGNSPAGPGAGAALLPDGIDTPGALDPASALEPPPATGVPERETPALPGGAALPEEAAALRPSVPVARPQEAEAIPEGPPAAHKPLPRPGGRHSLGHAAEARRETKPAEDAPAPGARTENPGRDAPAPSRNRLPVELYTSAAVPAVAQAQSPAPVPARPEGVSRREAAASAKSHLAFGARLVAKPAEAVEAVPPGNQSEKAERRASDPAPVDAPRRVARSEAALDPAPDDTPEQRPAGPSLVQELSSSETADRAETPDRSAAPKPALRAQPVAEPPKGSAVARDIRLEVGGGDRRVEVRVVERAGEVQLAVRTPDNRLAGTLRENLPLLSSRLEQSGWYADGWHAAEAGGPARRLEAPFSPPSSGDSPRQGGGGREQRDQEPRPQRPEERNETKQKGPRFEWLMDSLR